MLNKYKILKGTVSRLEHGKRRRYGAGDVITYTPAEAERFGLENLELRGPATPAPLTINPAAFDPAQIGGDHSALALVVLIDGQPYVPFLGVLPEDLSGFARATFSLSGAPVVVDAETLSSFDPATGETTQEDLAGYPETDSPPPPATNEGAAPGKSWWETAGQTAPEGEPRESGETGEGVNSPDWGKVKGDETGAFDPVSGDGPELPEDLPEEADPEPVAEGAEGGVDTPEEEAPAEPKRKPGRPRKSEG